MGIFTNTSTLNESVSVDLFSPAEVELQTEGCEINFTEAAIMAVAECEEVYNKSMKAIGIGELMFMESHGHEIIYEAVDLRAIGEKIKMFFKKIIDKAKAILHAFITKMSSFLSSSKGFVDKYKKEFVRKWSDVKSDFEFKGYKFTIDGIAGRKAELKVSNTADDYNNAIGTMMASLGYGDNMSLSTLEELNKKVRENKEEHQDEARAGVFEVYKTKFNSSSNVTHDSLDSKEFSEELFKLFRNGESSKENIEKKDLNSVDIVRVLENDKKTREVATAVAESVTKLSKKCIETIDKEVNKITKTLPSKDKNTQAAQEETNKGTAKITALNLTSECVFQTMANASIVAQGIILQAIKDNAAQCKAIMAKVIAGGKKMTEESVDYGHGSTGSFLDSVVVR